MAGQEGYGGACPLCGKPVHVKSDTGSHALVFDACGHCGFAYGTAADPATLELVELDPEEVWSALVRHGGPPLERPTAAAFQAAYVAACGEQPDVEGTAFVYDGDAPEALEARRFDLHREIDLGAGGEP